METSEVLLAGKVRFKLETLSLIGFSMLLGHSVDPVAELIVLSLPTIQAFNRDS